MTNITCVLWDHDDTLLSTFELRARATAHAALEVLGREVDGAEMLRSSHGRSLEEFAADLGGGTDSGPAFIAAYRDFYYSRNNEGLEVYPGISDALQAVAAREVLQGVVTAKLGRGARDELGIVGLAQFLPVVIGAEDVPRSKPHADPFIKAMGELGANAAETLMIGDTPADVMGARAAGIRVAAALWGSSDREAIIAAAPDHTLEHPSELLALL